MESKKAGVIFDMDGVMVLTEEAHWVAWHRVSAAHGVELTRDLFLDCFGQVPEQAGLTGCDLQSPAIIVIPSED